MIGHPPFKSLSILKERTMAASIKDERTDIVNGINVDDVRNLIQAVKSDPGKGATHWSVSSTWRNGTHSRARVESFDIGGSKIPRSFTIDIDEPAELGGGNLHANPQEFLLAALNACMMVGYSVLCTLNGITLDKLEITTEGDIDLRGFFGIEQGIGAGYDSLRIQVTVKGDGTPEQFRKIHDMVLATSPNVHNIATAVKLEPELVIE
jgi:uncharacterized OsmC-like protein